MLGHTCLPIVDTVIAGLTLTTAGLTTAVLVAAHHHRHVSVVLFLAGAYACAAAALIKSVACWRRPALVPLLVHFVAAAYHIGSGILLVVRLITRQVPVAGAVAHWATVVPALFVVTVFLLAVSCVLSAVQYLYHDDDVSQADDEASVQTDPTVHPSATSIPASPYRMDKKTSDITLIESKPDAADPPAPDIDHEPSELAFYIKSSIENPDHDHHYLAYTNNNWMGSTGQLSSLRAYEDISAKSSYSDFSRGRRGSKLFGNTRSTFSMDSPAPRRSFTNYRDSDRRNSWAPPKDDSRAVKTFKSSPALRQEPEPAAAGPAKHSHLAMISDESGDPPVKRSKSTSFIGRKSQRREQRWKSIHDERTFLSNVNESLLPPVLKKGESPIMQIKRQQELLEAGFQGAGAIPATSEPAVPAAVALTASFPPPAPTAGVAAAVSPPTPAAHQYSHLSPVGEVEVPTPDEDLPHINEFGEPAESMDFPGFDQDYVLHPPKARKKPKYAHTVPIAATAIATAPDSDDPNHVLAGLEGIPKSTRTVSWFKEEPSGLNSISLQEWDDNSHLYHQLRTRSGVNLNVAGITRMVSDHNLNPSTADPSPAFLLPPLENRTDDLDNIDNLSDSFAPAASTRSFSAPSLHTFRNLSGNTTGEPAPPHALVDDDTTDYASTDIVLDSARLDTQLTLFKTPPDSAAATASSSPIKKLLESPKRLGSVFRRKSGARRSMDDHADRHHKHTSSMISNQLSLASVVSSRSGSPKKSLKSYLTSRSHKHSESMASVLVTKPTITFEPEPLDFWDLDTNPGSEKSRVSSIPSVVIGEYDREKWRTLKALAEAAPGAASGANPAVVS